MDFGLVGIEGLVPPQNTPASGVFSLTSEQPQVLEGKPKSDGSAPIKQERSNPFEDEGTRVSKLAKKADDLGLRSSDNALPKQQMLSFSSCCAKPEVNFVCGKDVRFISDKNTPNLSLSYFQQSAYFRNPTGFSSGNLSGGYGSFAAGIRGPFTPAQWVELEHQAMIYKYLIANVPVPANLLIPIRKALGSPGFPGFSVGSYPPHSYGWGSFHLGFSGSTDPEPGRCRRTDGKKWRCSRDAVPDQKYCERHINRGRHRSRKPVEGHTGQAASGPTSTKVIPSMSVPLSSLVTSNGSVSNSITIAQHQIKGVQPAGATNATTSPIINRFHDQQGLSVTHPSINQKSKDSTFSVPKHVSMDESLQSEFGHVSADSLLNPSERSPYLGCRNYNSLSEFNAQQNQDHYSLRHFMDDWSKDQSNRAAIPWQEGLKSDWTQLSMSISMSSGLSSTVLPDQEKVAISPLRLTREVDPSQIGLGIGTIISESDTGTKQNTWIPIAWGSSMGGPLGEALNNTGNTAEASKSTMALHLKGEEWDGGIQLGASPTGVLQKSTFVSLSNSSSGGSPKEENKATQERDRLSDDLLVSAAHASSSSIPSV